MGVGLIVGVWVARYLGPDQFGLFNYAVAFVGLLGALSSLGLDQIVVRDIVGDPESATQTIATAFVLKLVGGVATVLVAAVVITALRPEDSLTQWLVGIMAAGAIFQAFDAIDLWFQSLVRSKYTVYAKNTAFVIASLGRIALIAAHAPLVAFALISLAELAVGATGLVVFYHRTGRSINVWRSSFTRAKLLLRDSWPLIVTSISIAIYMKANSLILAEMMGSSELGVYSAAARIAEVFYFIPMAIVSSVYPSIIEAKRTNEVLYHSRLEQLFTVMTSLGYVTAIPIMLFARPIVELLYGESYAAAVPILMVHVWTAPFVYLGVASSIWLVAENLTKLYLLRTVVSAFAGVALGLALIPVLSGVGASIATLASQILVGFASNAMDSRSRKVFVMQARSLLLVPIVRKMI